MLATDPFPHFVIAGVLGEAELGSLYAFFESTDLWEYTRTDFYTQYEFSLLHAALPEACGWINDAGIIAALEKDFCRYFGEKSLKLTAVTAHKLTDGYRMGVHNDFLGGEETHRLVIQVNRNWSEDRGGFLMLFHSDQASDVARVVQPLNNSAMGFEISERSFHAVSTVHDFTRYTLVYTFAREDDGV